MSRTISLHQLPRKAERLLRIAWEKHESVLLERDGEPVAAVVPMEDYQRLHPESPKGGIPTQLSPSSFAYELPADLLADYHRLVSKKLIEGLTPDEEAEFERVSKELDEADTATPLEQAIDARARREHERRMATLNNIIDKLKSLQES